MINEGLVDILTMDNQSSFTVDNTVQQVNHSVGPGIISNMVNADGNGGFLPQDNFVIMSIGLVLPFCFKFSIAPAEIEFRWRQGANTAMIVPLRETFIPIPDVEIPINSYVGWGFPPPMDETANAYICLYKMSINISMVGVPDSLNGEVLQVTPFIKIHHNKFLQV